MASVNSVIHVTVVGPAGSGKSMLIMKWIHPSEAHDDYNPTIEESLSHNVTVNGVQCTFYILDTSGIDEFASLRSQWLQAADGIILVFDLSDRASFEQIPAWCQTIQASGDPDRPVMILGNKSDLPRQIEAAEGSALAEQHQWEYREASTTTRQGVGSVFLDVGHAVLARHAAGRPDRDPTGTGRDVDTIRFGVVRDLFRSGVRYCARLCHDAREH